MSEVKRQPRTDTPAEKFAHAARLRKSAKVFFDKAAELDRLAATERASAQRRLDDATRLEALAMEELQ